MLRDCGKKVVKVCVCSKEAILFLSEQKTVCTVKLTRSSELRTSLAKVRRLRPRSLVFRGREPCVPSRRYVNIVVMTQTTVVLGKGTSTEKNAPPE